MDIFLITLFFEIAIVILVCSFILGLILFVAYYQRQKQVPKVSVRRSSNNALHKGANHRYLEDWESDCEVSETDLDEDDDWTSTGEMSHTEKARLYWQLKRIEGIRNPGQSGIFTPFNHPH